jgi:hypothetical protein
LNTASLSRKSDAITLSSREKLEADFDERGNHEIGNRTIHGLFFEVRKRLVKYGKSSDALWPVLDADYQIEYLS